MFRGLEKTLEHSFLRIRRSSIAHYLPAEFLRVRGTFVLGKKANPFVRKTTVHGPQWESRPSSACHLFCCAVVHHASKTLRVFFFNNIQKERYNNETLTEQRRRDPFIFAIAYIVIESVRPVQTKYADHYSRVTFADQLHVVVSKNTSFAVKNLFWNIKEVHSKTVNGKKKKMTAHSEHRCSRTGR